YYLLNQEKKETLKLDIESCKNENNEINLEQVKKISKYFTNVSIEQINTINNQNQRSLLEKYHEKEPFILDSLKPLLHETITTLDSATKLPDAHARGVVLHDTALKLEEQNNKIIIKKALDDKIEAEIRISRADAEIAKAKAGILNKEEGAQAKLNKAHAKIDRDHAEATLKDLTKTSNSRLTNLGIDTAIITDIDPIATATIITAIAFVARQAFTYTANAAFIAVEPD
ncbi:MAG: hypothetical protein ACJAZS_000745, partial [Alteromonas naphthalenivorans]